LTRVTNASQSQQDSHISRTAISAGQAYQQDRHISKDRHISRTGISAVQAYQQDSQISRALANLLVH